MISLIRELLECFTRLNILQDLEWAQNACTEACERTERSRVARLTALNAARTGGAVTGAAPNGGACDGACGGSSSSSRIVSTTPTGGRVNALTTAPLNGGRVNAQQVLDILDRELRSKEIAISDLFDRYAIEIEIEISDPFDRHAIRSRRAGPRGAGCMHVLTTASARPQVCKRRAGTRNGQQRPSRRRVGQQRPSRRRVGRGPEGDARATFDFYDGGACMCSPRRPVPPSQLMPKAGYLRFLREEQGMQDATEAELEAEWRQVYRQVRLHGVDGSSCGSSCGSSSAFTEEWLNETQFHAALFSPHNEAFDPHTRSSVVDDMTLPLSDYYCNSSHNSYLEGNQLTSRASTDMYEDPSDCT